MGNFIRYQHVERFGSEETEGIVSLTEPCYVFPKLDGTNGSIWLDEGKVCFGSRNRELSLDKDNHGFMTTCHTQERFRQVLEAHPEWRLYGEWLVPHTLKSYQDNAWREFYVFDVVVKDGDDLKYLPYDEYAPILESFGIEVVPPLAIVERGTLEQFQNVMRTNSYLIADGAEDPLGEGIVIKRYGFRNKYGRVVWAKLVRSEFKTQFVKALGPARFQATEMVEERIVERFLTKAMVDKVHANIVAECGSWERKYIPRLLHTCFYDLVREESWNFVKAFKNPTVNFGDLMKFCFAAVKQHRPDLF